MNFADVIDSNLKERKRICNSYKIDCITFLQPFPHLHALHQDEEYNKNDIKIQNLDMNFNIIESIFTKNGAISLINALQDYKKHAFVDGSHYNSEANKIIASSIHMRLN